MRKSHLYESMYYSQTLIYRRVLHGQPCPIESMYLTSVLRIGKKRVAVATLETNSVTPATMTEMHRAMAARGTLSNRISLCPIHSLKPDTCIDIEVCYIRPSNFTHFCSLSNGKSRSQQDDHIPREFLLYGVPVQKTRGRPCLQHVCMIIYHMIKGPTKMEMLIMFGYYSGYLYHSLFHEQQQGSEGIKNRRNTIVKTAVESLT